MIVRMPTILFADLGSARIAAYTAMVEGCPVAVVNTAARDDPDVLGEACQALTEAGIDPALLLQEVSHGIRG